MDLYMNPTIFFCTNTTFIYDLYVERYIKTKKKYLLLTSKEPFSIAWGYEMK